MRSIKFVLAIVIAVLSISFTTYNYSEKAVFNPAFYIAENQWELQETVWSESNESFQDSQISFKFNINQIYKLSDTKGRQYAGTWSVKKDNDDYYLILDEGKVIEVKYKIASIDEENSLLSLEKINSSSGNLNITYVFKTE